MRLLCQHIAVRANCEDSEVGKFFQSRYRAVRLCDEEAVLACSVYVDLNPIRANLAQTIEDSDFTSAKRRVQAISNEPATVVTSAEPTRPKPDDFLSPLPIDELHDELGAVPSKSRLRCSDKGFLPLSTLEYLELLDWSARRVVPGKSGSTDESVPGILERLSIAPSIWLALITRFGKLFSNVAGRPRVIDDQRSRVRHRRFYLSRETRELLAAGT